MKLIRLKLGTSFRSLPAGFEINFLREQDHKCAFDFHPYCLAGLNGSGKSNLLEALAAIFYHIECVHLDPDSRPEGFITEDEENFVLPGFNPRRCKPDAFEIEYFIPVVDFLDLNPITRSSDGKPFYHIRITKEENLRPIICVVVFANSEAETPVTLKSDDVKSVLPTYILGYSSGHNEVLSLPFFKMRFVAFDEYRDKLVKRINYPDRPESRMIYLDDQFSQVILLCHYLFPADAVTKVFQEKIKLVGFRCFRLIIRRFKRVDLEQAVSRTTASKELPPQTAELTESFDRTIRKLIKCSTTHFEEPRPDEDDEAVDLYLDYWIDSATKAAFAYHFRSESGGTKQEQNAASALNLFHAFRVLLTLNLYRVNPETKLELYQSSSLYVNETIPTPASDERIARFKDTELIKHGAKDKMYLKSLSDGEHQLLHTIGLCLLFRYESALFLLDEPETHLNPGWRASYISTLRAALEANKDVTPVMREILLTSHSPFIISDCRPENVLIFEKKDGQVGFHRPDFNTFGASANAITMKVFGQTETIGDHAMDKIVDLRRRLDQGENPRTLIKEAGKVLGDSVEKVLFVNHALNRMKEA